MRTTALAGIAGLSDLAFLGKLPPVSAADAQIDPKVVRLNAEIEPLVRLLEETPRDKLLEEVAARIHKGLSYREVLAALLLAGVRNVEPRPSVGFKFHAVLVVNSAHLASLASPDSERWLPIFWALDNFKSSQAQNIKERNGWRMAPVNETAVPPARKARQAFINAMEKWDAEAADAAIAGLVRTAGAEEVMELFWRYAPRDFRSIGHKIIFASNSNRTLGVIGWQHAEPVLRSLTYALVAAEGSPVRDDSPADRPGKQNRELTKEIKDSWLEGKIDTGATTDLLAALRQASAEEMPKKVVETLNKGVSVQSVWDALLSGAGELLMRAPGIVGLHAVTSTNAIRYAFETSGDDTTRRFALLQNASFLPLFREAIVGRKQKMADLRIDTLEPIAPKAEGSGAVGEIFADLSRDKLSAARKTLTYLKGNERPQEFLDTARLMIFFKGRDSHDYKFSSAVLEDYAHLSPAWRDRYLAANIFWLKGSGDQDNALVKRTRAALKV
jgi:hypothetical protein